MPSSPARARQKSQSRAAKTTAAPLNGDSILTPAQAVAWVVVEQEVVLHDARTATSYVLNLTAALLWRCLDGESTIDEILADIAEAFDLDQAAVRKDVAPVLSAWVDDDLVTQDRS